MGKIQETQEIESFLSDLEDDIKDIIKMIDKADETTALDICIDIKDILEKYYDAL